MGSNLPVPPGGSRFEGAHAVWIRIGAYLSTKAHTTQATYRGIIQEWCEFLGAPAGSQRGAERIVRATDLDAIKYRRYLEQKIGQKPRLQQSVRVTPKTEIIIAPRAKIRRDGLQHTLANATIRKKFTALRRLYTMLIASELGATRNPFAQDRAPAPPAASGQKRPTEMVDFALVKKIIDAPDVETPRGVQDRAILAVMFGGALRRGEVINLRIGDVRVTPAGTTYLVLRATKGKRDASQALPAWAAEAVSAQLAIRAEQRAASGDHLFISYRGRGAKSPTSNPISPAGLYQIFLRYCRLAGAGPHVTPHSARATAITKLLADGIPHREVQEFSRHASVQMVEVYDKRRIGVDQNPGRKLDYD